LSVRIAADSQAVPKTPPDFSQIPSSSSSVNFETSSSDVSASSGFAGNHVAAAQPAVEVDIGAAARTERMVLLARWFAADRTGPGRLQGDDIIGHGTFDGRAPGHSATAGRAAC
jgi:hypothetical protein